MSAAETPSRVLTHADLDADDDLFASLDRAAEELRTLEPALPRRIDANPE